MSENKKATLFFIPFPILSHLAAAVNTANLLVDRDERLSITILIMKLPIDTKISSCIKNSPNSRINFVELPENNSSFSESTNSPKNDFVVRFVESQIGPVRAAVAEIMEKPKSGQLAGFVVDMICTAMIDVANEFRTPSYIFFTCGSGTLGLMFRLQSLGHDQIHDLKEYEDSDFEISVPTFVNPVPAKVWPSSMFEKERGFLEMIRRFRETKGIMINTFLELEPHAIKSLTDDEKIPRIYPVGPILQSGPGEKPDENEKIRDDEIMEWLDGQPDSSVVFLCFGSRGSFDEDQVKEIAVGLESSGHRFLWSLRKPPPKERMEFPGEYENPGEVLPEGFLGRTVGIGKVVGWAPQIAVLSHRAVGGFVSHCGWNSILESVWCGVPVAVWPLYAEQQLNAFELVKELEMAEAIRIDYKRDWRGDKKPSEIVGAEEIEVVIRRLMATEEKGGSGVRRKVKEMQKKSRMALQEDGSSYNAQSLFIEDVIKNID